MNHITFISNSIIEKTGIGLSLKVSVHFLSIYYAAILIPVLAIVISVIGFLSYRAVIDRYMVTADKLFSAALKQENDGYFREAHAGYLAALHEVEAKRFQDDKFRNKILEKIKLLHTVIQYTPEKKISVD